MRDENITFNNLLLLEDSQDSESGDTGNQGRQADIVIIKEDDEEHEEEDEQLFGSILTLNFDNFDSNLEDYYDNMPSSIKSRNLSTRRRSSVMEYEQSVLFGQYHEKLATFARMQSAQKRGGARRSDRSEDDDDGGGGGGYASRGRFRRRFLQIAMTFGNWPLLFVLGIIISILSFVVDVTLKGLLGVRSWLMEELGGEDNWFLGYLIWTGHATALIMTAACTTRWISPQAAGSGVAEMKVIIRGVVIKEYLSLRTLAAKLIGVPLMLAAGLGLGKEGPFVHIASMVTNQLFKIFGKVTMLPNEYETRFQELITIACAVGVAGTFAAPIGSVLYSIEIVKSFFAVRSYWEGFFACTWAAILWRLWMVWFEFEKNIGHLLPTHFRTLYPYETSEMVLFAILGILCGLISFLFVRVQRSIVLVNRKKSAFSELLAQYPLAYPLLVSFVIASLKYPYGLAKFSSAHMSMEDTLHELFSNFTWHNFNFKEESGEHATTIPLLPHYYNESYENSSTPTTSFSHDIIDPMYAFQSHIVQNWSSDYTNVFANTIFFVISNFFTIAVASTVPVPGGLIVPLLFLGAGFGRFFGELASLIFPKGISHLSHSPGIIPGAYAVAASAAVCGGITGSLSVAVIAFEITGQLTHFLPIIVCVLFSNLIARYLGMTIYEQTIELKNLPFLPTMIQASAFAHRVLVEDFMDREVQFVWTGCNYHTLNNIINSPQLLAFYPFVSSPDSKHLLGIIHQMELKSLLENQMSKSVFKSSNNNNNKESTGAGDTTSTSTGAATANGRSIISNFGPYRVTYAANKTVWEEKMNSVVDFSSCHIDPAPLQIMEGTPLSNVHNLFSLLSLQVVYVTSLGRLTGVVSLKDLRSIIERVERGEVPGTRPDHAASDSLKDAVIEEDEEGEEEGQEVKSLKSNDKLNPNDQC